MSVGAPSVSLRQAVTATLVAAAALAGCGVERADEPSLSFDVADLSRTHDEVFRYWARQLDAGGLFVYLSSLAGDLEESDASEDNVIRQAMSSRLLAEIASECPDVEPALAANLDTVIQRWYRVDRFGNGRLERKGKAKVGASGVMLQAIARSPDPARYRAVAEGLVNGILSVWSGDRQLDPWIRAPAYEYDADYLLTFYSGEAILGLQEIATILDLPLVSRAALEMQKGFARLYVDSIESSFYPSYVPWHTMSMRRYASHGPDGPRWRSAIVRMNRHLIELQDTVRYIGRFHHPALPQYGEPHASSDAIYVEGLTYAYRIAVESGDGLAAVRSLRAIVRGSNYLMERSITAGDAGVMGLGSTAIGAVPSREGSDEVRVDNLQHTLDAFRSIRRLIEDGVLTERALVDADVDVLTPVQEEALSGVCPRM